MTDDEKQCENYFVSNHYRNKEGRYVVRLPLRTDIGPLGDSRQQAVARLLQMERKFKTNNTLRLQYTNFINEYLTLGHMEPISTKNLSPTNCYLPHHAVFKENDPSHKIRVVFDASAKTSNGISLNNKMLVGPTLQKEIFSTILR